MDTATERLMNKDIFLKAKNVSILNIGSFYQFLTKKDLSLVMFYNSEKMDKAGDEDTYKKRFIQASNITNRPNHAYVAVDCGRDEMLCRKEGIKQYPVLTLYFRDQQVDSVNKRSEMTAVQLKALVEQWSSDPVQDCC